MLNWHGYRILELMHICLTDASWGFKELLTQFSLQQSSKLLCLDFFSKICQTSNVLPCWKIIVLWSCIPAVCLTGAKVILHLNNVPVRMKGASPSFLVWHQWMDSIDRTQQSSLEQGLVHSNASLIVLACNEAYCSAVIQSSTVYYSTVQYIMVYYRRV